MLEFVKLKDLFERTRNPKTQQVEIMEDHVISVKTVFEGIVQDIPEDMLNKYCISDWYPREGTSVLAVLVWVNPHERPDKQTSANNKCMEK